MLGSGINSLSICLTELRVQLRAYFKVLFMLRDRSDSSTTCSTPTDFNESSLQKERVEWPLKFVTQSVACGNVCLSCAMGDFFNERATSLVVFWALILLCAFDRLMHAVE